MGNAGTLFEKSRGARVRGRFRQDPTTVVTANGEVQTNEEAQAYVHDLDLFVTVQILDDTPAVLSLGKLCEEHSYSCEWASGQKATSGASSSSTSLQQDSSRTSSSPAEV